MLGYFLQGLGTLRKTRAERFQIIGPSQKTAFSASTLAVANGSQYGNNALIAPEAQCDDGMLELSALPPLTCLNLPGLAHRLFLGRLSSDRRVLRLRAPDFEVHREHPGWIHTDGETHPAGTCISFKVVPASLRILCPFTVATR